MAKEVIDEGQPGLILYLPWEQMKRLCKAQVAGMTHQRGVGQEEATATSIETEVGAQMVDPGLARQDEGRQGLDEDARLGPDQMEIGLLGHEDVAADESLPVQRPGSAGQASEPQVPVNPIEPGDVQLLREIGVDVGAGLQKSALRKMDEDRYRRAGGLDHHLLGHRTGKRPIVI